MLNNLILFLNLIPFLTLGFFINTFNTITLWYLAGIYLITTGLYLLIEDADIFVGFLWVIDLGVGLIFFIFILHFSTLFYYKPNLDKTSKVLNNSFFLFIVLCNFLFIFSEPLNNQNYIFKNSNWFFLINWYDFYDSFFLQTVTDLNLLKELYFHQNSIEFFIINFVLLYGILSAIILTFVINPSFLYDSLILSISKLIFVLVVSIGVKLNILSYLLSILISTGPILPVISGINSGSNGNFDTSTIASYNLSDNTAQLNVCYAQTWGGNYNGSISVMQIYNRTLTATEIAQNFNAHRGRYGI